MADDIAPITDQPKPPTKSSGHLVERMVQRLRGIGGFSAPGATAPASPVVADTVAAGIVAPDTVAPDTVAPGAADPVEPQATAADAAPAAALTVPDAEPVAEPAPEPVAAAVTPPASSRPNVDAMLARVVADAPPGLARAAAEIATTATGGSVALPATGPVFIDHAMLEKAGMVVGRKLRTRISEEFRITVGAILRSLKGSYTPGRGAGNLLMVTSSRPGEGKSFTSLNLAGSIAQHTQREVLLVDVDAKQHSLTDLIGIGDLPGLIDLAANATLRMEDTIVRTAIGNLSFLPVGVRREDGGDQVGDSVPRPVTSLIERLGRRFPNHLIILDAPPCLSTSDPSTLAPHVGQIVMVVEAERTQRAEVMASLDLVKACPQIILLLNKIKVTTSYTFGAYHYGAYNYSGTYP